MVDSLASFMAVKMQKARGLLSVIQCVSMNSAVKIHNAMSQFDSVLYRAASRCPSNFILLRLEPFT